jgi:hypothetical protein
MHRHGPRTAHEHHTVAFGARLGTPSAHDREAEPLTLVIIFLVIAAASVPYDGRARVRPYSTGGADEKRSAAGLLDVLLAVPSLCSLIFCHRTM